MFNYFFFFDLFISFVPINSVNLSNSMSIRRRIRVWSSENISPSNHNTILSLPNSLSFVVLLIPLQLAFLWRFDSLNASLKRLFATPLYCISYLLFSFRMLKEPLENWKNPNKRDWLLLLLNLTGLWVAVFIELLFFTSGQSMWLVENNKNFLHFL